MKCEYHDPSHYFEAYSLDEDSLFNQSKPNEFYIIIQSNVKDVKVYHPIQLDPLLYMDEEEKGP
jgi:hypothetical protein